TCCIPCLPTYDMESQKGRYYLKYNSRGAVERGCVYFSLKTGLSLFYLNTTLSCWENRQRVTALASQPSILDLLDSTLI
ncbi:MAG: hypothetical protein ACK53Y_09785, partial [bacterium]